MLLLNASGCLDALVAPEVAGSFDAFVTKTVTPEPREGNAPPRIAETDAGMLNAIGLANPGRDAFVARVLPKLREELSIPIWVSVGGFSSDDYAATCSQLPVDDVAAVELNLSCPNVDEAPETAAEIVAACRDGDVAPALREAVTARLGRRRGGASRRGRRRGRDQPREHAARAGARRSARTRARPWDRRLLGRGTSPGGTRRRVRGTPCNVAPDRRYGRCLERA